MARTRRSIAFGVILREYREAMKLSQDGLGLEAHLDRKFIWLLENGHRLPTLDSLFKLAEALQVAPAVMVARMSSLQPSAPHKKRAKRPDHAPIPFGEEECPRCKAVYTLRIRRSSRRGTGRFKCGFCKRDLSTWTGTFELLHSAHLPPRHWPRR